ncbi:hypothetical protein [Methylophilus sp.]|uniref:hypothetical protein n=1 Tax=Methylophilus sp. TaxID=29541 RepID=UPI0040361CA0
MEKMKTYLKGLSFWVTGFFFNFLWLGVALLLYSIILDLYYQRPTLFTEIVIKLLEGVGTSILIASIFSYASTTYDFVEKIRRLLEDIIIKRNFLGNMDPESKKEALKSLIQPSDSEINKYPNIGNYYGYFISKTLEIAKRSVRSNYQINARAFVDKKNNHIAVDATYSYRAYPCSEGFQDIIVGWQLEGINSNSCELLTICTPDGHRTKFVEGDLDFKEFNDGGDISKRATIPIAEIGKGHDCLDVELRVIEYGSVNSFLFSFKALQPTDGFKLHLHCDEDLFIKSNAVFVVGAKYYLDVDPKGKSINVTCNQWINEGTGISILIALPDQTELSDGTNIPEPVVEELDAASRELPIVEVLIKPDQVAG